MYILYYKCVICNLWQIKTNIINENIIPHEFFRHIFYTYFLNKSPKFSPFSLQLVYILLFTSLLLSPQHPPLLLSWLRQLVQGMDSHLRIWIQEPQRRENMQRCFSDSESPHTIYFFINLNTNFIVLLYFFHFSFFFPRQCFSMQVCPGTSTYRPGWP